MKLAPPSMRALSPSSLLRLYMFIVVAAAAAAVAVVFFASSKMEARSRETSRLSQAAIDAASIQAGLGQPIQILADGLFIFLASDTYRALPPDVQAALPAALSGPPGNEAAASQFPAISIRLADKDAIQFSRMVEFYVREIDSLLQTAADIDLRAVELARERVLGAVEAYLDDPSALNFDVMFMSLTGLSDRLQESAGVLSSRVRQEQANLNRSMDTAKNATIVALGALLATMVGATIFVGRLIHESFTAAQQEQQTLRSTTETLRYRNNQLNALYNVFAEITDTLSLRYVIRATVREAMALMNANMTVLRLLKGNELVVGGTMNDTGEEVPGLPPVPLGEGPHGRTARRGRTLRIDRNAQDQLGPSVEEGSRVESGIIAPLIVGARVVGTLSVWSRRPETFTVDDERVLEMMASQVATAVVAADTTERSERRAHQDALTGLPNRLQLTEDLVGDLSLLLQEGRRAVVAMADIDHFKRFNDDYGHKVGDVTLQQVASVLRNSVRENDRVYRFGGEEFVLVFLDIGPEGARSLAERVRNAVASTPLTGDNLEPVGPVTISIGLAALPDHDTNFNHLIELADKAMYQAKDAGRNKVVFWNENEGASIPSLVA